MNRLIGDFGALMWRPDSRRSMCAWMRLVIVHHSKLGCSTSGMGQLHALPRRSISVRFTSNEQTPAVRVECDAMCTFGLMHRSKNPYSITSSARISNAGGNVMPNALAVLRLMISSNLDAYATDTRRQDWPPKSVAIATAATHSRS
jgi:hypothetical protein